jgi:hypothetical protein
MTSSKSKIASQISLFRKLALSLEGAIESAHMGHPDFRVNNRIFATLSYQDKGFGVLKLTPEQQESFVAERPECFSPVHGGWGRSGMTFLHLEQAEEALIEGALATAYRNLQKRQSRKKSPASSTPSAKPARPSRGRLQ